MVKIDKINLIKTLLLTTCAMVAFAANSIFCRYALGGDLIDASSFTIVRIASGASLLAIISLVSKKEFKNPNPGKTKWLMPIMLTIYALFFSYAYISLSAGTGALILFGAVQATMIISGWMSGERMNSIQIIGLFMAVSGLIYLVLPGLSAPSPFGAFLMAIAGIAWGIYSLLGKTSKDPVATTSFNFIYSTPIVLIAGLIIFKPIHISFNGAIAAILSGTIASGTGYVIWYTALEGLTAMRAAIVQLTVPVIAALAGLILLSEAFSLRLIIASTIILFGVGMALTQKTK